MLDDFKCHRDKNLLADLKKETNTDIIMNPGSLTLLIQPLDRTPNKEMKHQLRAKYTAHIAQAIVDPNTVKLPVPAWSAVSRWATEAWVSTPASMLTKCLRVCGLTLNLDGGEDHEWCEHNFGKGYRRL